VDHIYNKEGLRKLLRRDVTVNLKIDTSAIVVGKESGVVKYWSREGRDEIDHERRLAIDLWEPFISHLNRGASKLPDNCKVFIEFFSKNLKTIIKYKTHPTNDMIISYVALDGVTLMPNDDRVIQIANDLNIALPPVIFSGKLNTAQKSLISAFNITTTDFSDYLDYCGFPIPDELSYLIEGGIEGVCLYFDGPKIETYKMVDPEFSLSIVEKKKFGADNFHHYCSNLVFSNFEMVFNACNRGQTKFQLLEDMARVYCKLEPARTLPEQFKICVPESRFSRLNFKYLPKSVSEMVDENWMAEDIYRILLLSLRKPRLRAMPKLGLTKEIKEFMNRAIDLIK